MSVLHNGALDLGGERRGRWGACPAASAPLRSGCYSIAAIIFFFSVSGFLIKCQQLQPRAANTPDDLPEVQI